MVILLAPRCDVIPFTDMERPESVRKFFRLSIGIGALFLLLGVGNIWFGQEKLDHYNSLLSPAVRSLTTPDPNSPLPNRDQQERIINRLRRRVSFYAMVVEGGKYFLGVAGIFLISAVISAKACESDSDAP